MLSTGFWRQMRHAKMTITAEACRSTPAATAVAVASSSLLAVTASGEVAATATLRTRIVGKKRV